MRSTRATATHLAAHRRALRLKERRRPSHEMRFITGADTAACCRIWPVSDAQFHPGQYDQHDHQQSDGHGNNQNPNLWRRLFLHRWNQHHAIKCNRRKWHHLFSDNSRIRLSTGNRYQNGRRCRTAGHNAHHRNHSYYKLAVGLFAVIICLPVRAEDGGTTAIANPVATSTGSVSNQAVQINQGSYSQQSYGPGHQCNSATLVFTPFYLGNDVHVDPYVRNQNFGAQVSVSVPLSGEMVELCKELARRKLEKQRLDYALVRALKCAELFKTGYKIREDSPHAVLCADVVPVAAVVPTSQPSSRVTSAPSQRQP